VRLTKKTREHPTAGKTARKTGYRIPAVIGMTILI
jgi:hypothetical protein